MQPVLQRMWHENFSTPLLAFMTYIYIIARMEIVTLFSQGLRMAGRYDETMDSISFSFSLIYPYLSWNKLLNFRPTPRQMIAS